MFRRTDMLLIAAMIGVVSYTYSVKTGTKDIATELASVRQQIAVERNAIDLLNADWSVLTAPAKVQGLVDRFSSDLDLVELDLHRVIEISDIPMRPQAAAQLSVDDILARLGSANGAMTTGSITPSGEGR